MDGNDKFSGKKLLDPEEETFEDDVRNCLRSTHYATRRPTPQNDELMEILNNQVVILKVLAVLLRRSLNGD